jgi:hypothetical protein
MAIVFNQAQTVSQLLKRAWLECPCNKVDLSDVIFGEIAGTP